jgi:hypothetical protein
VTSVQFFISDPYLNNGATTPIGDGTLVEIFGVQIWVEQIDSRYLPNTYVSAITAVAADSQGHVGSAQALAGIDNKRAIDPIPLRALKTGIFLCRHTA